MKKNNAYSSDVSSSSSPSSSFVSCNLLNETHLGNEITDDEHAGEIICDTCGVVLEEKTLSYKAAHEKGDDVIL